MFHNEDMLKINTWRAMEPFSSHRYGITHLCKPRYSLDGLLYVLLSDVTQLGYALFVCIRLAILPREYGGSLHIPSSFMPARDAVT